MLNISGVQKIQGGEILYNNVSFQVNPGEKVGLVGPNGAGKTTLFRMIVGEERPDNGQISFPELSRMSYFSQDVGHMKGSTALEVVLSGNEEMTKLQKRLTEFEQKFTDPNLDMDEMNKVLQEMGEVQTRFEKLGGYTLESTAKEVLTGLGINPSLHQEPMDHFSGGQKMRIALARVLVMRPDLILMDEPTNYLDMETILWLEEWLKNFEGAIFMTTHDRYFMNNVCKKIVEIDHQTATVYSGNFDFYERERVLRRDQLISEHKRQQASIAKDEEFIAKFKARASHAAQVQSRIKKMEKIQRVVVPTEEKAIAFEFSTPPRGGDDVAVLTDLKKEWIREDDTPQLIFENLTTTIRIGERIALVGVNGAGKSTLLKVITGNTEATSGSATLGPSIKVGYFSQFSFDVLDPQASVLDEVRKSLHLASDGYLRNLLAAFLFRGDDVHKKVKYLSGGEKSRLILAVLLSQNNNFLVLDEPTNHLDIKSREVLLDALQKYTGTILFVSHDRHFLKELAQKVYEVGKGHVQEYLGNYDYYLSKQTTY